MLSDMFSIFQKKEKEFYREKCGTAKKKSLKNVIIKKVSYTQNFFKYV